MSLPLPTDAVPTEPTSADPAQGGQRHTYEFKVTMSCGGCSGAVERVLKKMDGLESYEVSLENQSATVITANPDVAYSDVLETIKKTGKRVTAGKADGEDRDV